MSESAPTDPDAQPAINVDQTTDSATEIDWAALWDEFGFDSPDAAGTTFASDTQLVAAVQSTVQSPAGDARGHIRQGVDDGVLIPRYTDGGTLRGYAFVGGER